ncbi:MAG: sortase [Actinobacteria bacterium]|nr:MAG: sortase [Actinomycetota bacterium]
MRYYYVNECVRFSTATIIMKKKILIFLSLIFFAVLAYFAYLNYPHFAYFLDQKKLDRVFSTAPKKTPKKFLVKPVPTKLVIKKIKFSQNIVYAKRDMASQLKALKKGPTHYGGTALPGQIGNIIIGGHYVSYTFKDLNKVTKGDFIKLLTPIQNFKYKVIETKVVNENALTEVKKYGNKNERLLTLYTCVYPSSITKSRFLAVAKQISP